MVSRLDRYDRNTPGSLPVVKGYETIKIIMESRVLSRNILLENFYLTRDLIRFNWSNINMKNTGTVELYFNSRFERLGIVVTNY